MRALKRPAGRGVVPGSPPEGRAKTEGGQAQSALSSPRDQGDEAPTPVLMGRRGRFSMSDPSTSEPRHKVRLSMREGARHAGCSQRHLYELAYKGEIPTYMAAGHRWVDEEDIDAYIARCKAAGPQFGRATGEEAAGATRKPKSEVGWGLTRCAGRGFTIPRPIHQAKATRRILNSNAPIGPASAPLEGLQQKAGVAQDKLIRLVLKELADNALDTGPTWLLLAVVAAAWLFAGHH